MSDRTFSILRISLLSLLIVWGFGTLFYYLGVPVHQSVLLSETARQAVSEACPSGGMICMGWNGFFPFIAQTLSWISPMTWYVVWSLIGLGVMAFISYSKHARWTLSLRLTPLKVLGLFVLSLWLTFTVISASDENGQPYNRIIEPLPQIYQGVDPEGLQSLQDNFKDLTDRGCLTEVGTANNGARVFDMKQTCVQLSFITMVLPHVFTVTYLLFIFLILGRAILGWLRPLSFSPLTEAVFSLATGACALIALLWLLAVAGGIVQQPVYSQVAGWAILLAIPAALYRQTRYWAETLWKREWTWEGAVYSVTLVLGWLLISYLALNFLNVVRPFPIGWDDLGKYINQPRLLVSYGYFIPQLASFQWEYITSLGFLLFGYDSVFGATSAMMFNWAAGVIAIAAVYAFGRTYFGRGGGLLSALLYYTLPLVGHFSYADMKVDNAVFAMGTFSLFAVFLALFPPQDDVAEVPEEIEPTPVPTVDWRWMVLAGVLGGFAFALKPTSIMVVMALGTTLFGVAAGWTGFLGAMSLAWALFLFEGRLNLVEISGRVYGDPSVLSKPLILGALSILGFGLMAYAVYMRPQHMKRMAIAAGIFIGSFVVSIAPWVMMNNISYGNVVPKLLFTAKNNITPEFIIGKGVVAPENPTGTLRILPEELRVDQSQCIGTAKSEELDRYWGAHSGWGHYLTLPWRSVMNIDSAGYYVTTYPALLLFPLLLLVPFFWMKPGRWLRWLFIGTAFMLAQWVFFANGIPWYGLGTFFGLVIGLEALAYRAPDRYSTWAAWAMIVFSLMTAYSQRFWQFSQQYNIFEYSTGKVSYEAMRERTIPYYDDIRDIVEQRIEQDPQHPYVYRIGTFIPYFLPRNLETLPVADHQLDFFKCLNQERDAALTLRRLKALGFNSIIFDTNTHTIETDPNGSLHQKVQQFVDFVNTPGLGLTLPISDADGGIAYILLP